MRSLEICRGCTNIVIVEYNSGSSQGESRHIMCRANLRGRVDGRVIDFGEGGFSGEELERFERGSPPHGCLRRFRYEVLGILREL